MTRNMILTAALAGILATSTWAQTKPEWAKNGRFELGIKGGAGAFQGGGFGRGLIGVEACSWCAGRFALFGEYSYWPQPLGNTSSRSASTAGVGLRIQQFGDWCLQFCFFDAGIAMIDGPSVGVAGTNNKTVSAIVLGVGVFIPAGQRLYVRPQVRGYLRGEDSATSVEIAIGWRF